MGQRMGSRLLAVRSCRPLTESHQVTHTRSPRDRALVLIPMHTSPALTLVVIISAVKFELLMEQHCARRVGMGTND